MSEFWMAESAIRTGILTPGELTDVWAVGRANREIAWFTDRVDAIQFKDALDKEYGYAPQPPRTDIG